MKKKKKKKDDKNNKSTQIPSFNLTIQPEEKQPQIQSSHLGDPVNITPPQNNFLLNKEERNAKEIL